MKIARNKILICMVFLVVLMSVGVFAQSAGTSRNIQFFKPGVSFHGEQFDFSPDACANRQDFLVDIVPTGCTPGIVRSDLLEEQNVPVFCKIMSFQLNPLLTGTRIRSISVTGQLPKGVSGISYVPSRSALQRKEFMTNPLNDDLGHLVVILSKQFNESSMPDYVEGNVSAVIDYDSRGTFGVGKNTLYLAEMTEEEWQRDYRQNGIWNGKAYLRIESILPEKVTVSIYRDVNLRENTVTIPRGGSSEDIYLGGSFCTAGMRLSVEDIGAPVDSALIQINNEQMWVGKGDRIINDRCIVRNIEIIGAGGNVDISCPRGKILLKLLPGTAKLMVENVETEYKINQKISDNLYLGYVGVDLNSKKFAVLIEDAFSNTELEFSDKEVFKIVEEINKAAVDHYDQEIRNRILEGYKKSPATRIGGAFAKGLGLGERIDVLTTKDIEKKVKIIILRKIPIDINGIMYGLADISTPKNTRPYIDPKNEGNYQDSLKYYEEAKKYYEDLADFYPQESLKGQRPLAAEGLEEAIILSQHLKQNKDNEEFLAKFFENYPDLYIKGSLDLNRNRLYKYDDTHSKNVVEVDGLTYPITLLNLKSPSKADSSVVFLVDGVETILGLNEFASGGKHPIRVNFQLIEMSEENVIIEYDYIEDGDKETGKESLNLLKTKETNIGGVNIKLININFKSYAKISVDSNVKNVRTKANFKFKIGIEKRAIQLSPEMTKKIMESMLDTIKEWEEINKKLGKVIKALKGACFATSAILTIKNLFDGGSGKSLARNRIMTSSGGWNDKCEEMVDRGEEGLTSVGQCLLKHSSDIEKDVKIYATEIERTNNELKKIQSLTEIERTDILDFQGQANSVKIEEEFEIKFRSFCRSAKGEIILPTVERERLTFEKDICNLKSMTHEQRRELMTLYRIRQAGGSDALKNVVNKDLGRIALGAKNFDDERIRREISIKNTRKHNLGIKTTYPVNDRITHGFIKTVGVGDSTHNVYGKYDKGISVIRIQVPNEEIISERYKYTPNKIVGGKEFIVQLKPLAGGSNIYSADSEGDIYSIDGNIEITGDAKKNLLEYMDLSGMKRIRKADSQSFSNQMVNIEQLRVKYFERVPYKGLPSLVPFDVDEGWYVQTTYVLSGFGKPYDESGRVANFYICNVGPNGEIEFKRGGDDICRYYNGHSQDINFPGMTIAESSLLVQKARRALEEASRQYGSQRVNVNGVGFNTGISSDGSEGRCTDFMSPGDCNIMFNVCDPVICPASRCDLGGRYRVDNVIQSGVIGSLALCLPNMKEGIAVPICLTGVHAGLDGYISILNSTAACLNESLETGRNIGICDEIKSVYMCEFFWRQATPFMNVLLERGFELFLGQGVRGGGEYLTARTAWANTQKSVEFFKNQYAVNSMKAFRARNTEFIGEDLEVSLCRNFISGGFSGAATNAFDALLEPDSPEQYHGWFSENPMTTVTVPPQSHYKVYFHIFAGKDIGAFYSVYLKDITLDPGIGSTGVWMVDRGYAGRGSQIDRAKDFVAPSGFKQLCININGQEECGFGKVSTSYALNALSDAYAKEQIEQRIISEKQCVAGAPSLYSLAQPNLQAGAQELIEPQLYNKGIVRVCATENPSKQLTSEQEFDRTKSRYDRWKEVGYCDDTTIKCWLDTSSVKDVIRDLGVEEEVLDEVNIRNLGVENYQLPNEGNSIIKSAENFIKSLYVKKEDTSTIVDDEIRNIVLKLKEVTNIGANNRIRANALLVLGRLYNKITVGFFNLATLTTSDSSSSVDKGEESGEDKKPVPEEDVPKDDDLKQDGGDSEVDARDDELKMNEVITLESFGRFSYSYLNSKWLTSDGSFDPNFGYVEGIKTIVYERLDFLEGKIIITGIEFLSKDYNNPTKMYNAIIQHLKTEKYKEKDIFEDLG